MAEKFAEHNGLNLTQVNKEILEKWTENDVFHKSVDDREGCPPHKRHFQPLQDDERISSTPKGRLGHSRASGGTWR